jgi:hypothetical protein
MLFGLEIQPSLPLGPPRDERGLTIRIIKRATPIMKDVARVEAMLTRDRFQK